MPVIFDLDGTIDDTERSFGTLIAEVLNEKGYTITAAETIMTVSGVGAQLGFEKIGRKLGLDFSPQEISSLVRLLEWKEAATEATKPMLVPGAKELIEAFHAEGHTLGLGSNRPSGYSRNRLDEIGLAPYFQERVFGPDHVGGLHKPDPAIFSLAMETMSKTTSAATAVIGDSFADAAAANAAGADLIIIRLDPCITDPAAVAEKTAQLESQRAHVVRNYHVGEIQGLIRQHIPA
jgi:phosphoglycolate phosphatase